jgi:hypothetical protein
MPAVHSGSSETGPPSMGRKPGPQGEALRVYRPPRSVWRITLTLFAIVLALTIVTFVVELEPWYRLTLVALCALFVVSFAELATRRIALDDERLILVDHFRRRAICRTAIDSVTWEKGGGVSLKLHDGSWARLPEVGNGSQALSNSIRAWLARTGRPA